jgi:SHS2 domain-containing protein
VVRKKRMKKNKNNNSESVDRRTPHRSGSPAPAPESDSSPASSLSSPPRSRHSDYRFLSKVALADIAFVARADALPALFEAAARALTEVMVDRRTLVRRVERRLDLTAATTDRLLYDFLTELIVLKDVDSLLFKDFSVSIIPPKGGAAMALSCRMRGEEIDRERHHLRNDVKAVTMHMFGVQEKKDGKDKRRSASSLSGETTWEATVVLDI